VTRDIFDRILRPLRQPPVTSRFPDQPPDLPPAARGMPELHPSKCDSSGACVVVCPTGAISLAESTWSLDVGLCIFCGACARACPRDAIRLGHGIELAVLDERDLIVEYALVHRP
jgi:formate hydrogenlyase subunit 6/NADH:ubiquinone oxidoreductase subunit I